MPFNALPRGAEVFIGPQTAGLVEALGSMLASLDAIAVVSGPAGTGKTTMVTYSLESLYKKLKIVRVGRSSLEPQDVLQSLLIVLGVANRPPDREQRLVILRDAFRQYKAAGVRVVVVVEDALTTGAAVLAEIAALTASDDESVGARIVLMGGNALPGFLERPEFADLQVRLSLQHGVNSFSSVETRGYLSHCFRIAGGDFDQLFDSDCSGLLHKICRGNARAINQLVEVVLRTADELNVKKISARYIVEVAAQIYDPEIHDFRLVTDLLENAKPEPDPNSAVTDAPATNNVVEAIKEEISTAKCLEDLDDVMAETLFGPELSELAAQATGGGS